MTKFRGSPEHANPGRIHKHLPDEGSKTVADKIFAKSAPADYLLAKEKQSDYVTKNCCTATVFAIATEKVTVGAEGGYVATYRYCYKGDREVLVVDFLALAEYVSKQRANVKKVTPGQVFSWLENCSVSDAQNYKDANGSRPMYF